MARPRGSKNRYQWWTGDHPNKGRPKPQRERACMHCGGSYMGFNGKGYCSRKCLFLANVEQSEGCWTWKGYKRPGGYGEAYIGREPRERILAHRLAYEVMIGPPGDRLVCHHCDNPPCCNPAHLFLGTMQDNMADRNAKGRQARGERNGPAKLTAEQVLSIRADARGCRKLAKAYGMSIGAIVSIRSGKSWKHLK